jgi:hypothetical protein
MLNFVFQVEFNLIWFDDVISIFKAEVHQKS